MNPWRSEFERQFVGENARPYPRAAVGRFDLEEPGVAIAAAAKAPNPRAARRGGFLQPIELRSIAIQDRGSVRLEAEDNLSLRVGDRLDRAEMLDVDGGDRRHEGDMRPRHAGERRNLARVIHAHLEHTEARVRRHAGERQGHAPMVIVGSRRSVGKTAGREHRAQHLFGRCLANRTGHCDDLCVRARARSDAQSLHCLQGVLNHERRTESSELGRALARHDGRRGAGFKGASDMIVSVMRIAPDGEEQVAILKRPAVDRDARDTRARAARSAKRRARRSVRFGSTAPVTASP